MVFSIRFLQTSCCSFVDFVQKDMAAMNVTDVLTLASNVLFFNSSANSLADGVYLTHRAVFSRQCNRNLVWNKQGKTCLSKTK